ncbi:hypothetical protein [Aneurinibacillus sp. REN35]|uniref:hypothetical protein n=1 Tax=Aneurinibacillus sp. REN35 TaxID=3237286 RepID=UPI0035274D22
MRKLHTYIVSGCIVFAAVLSSGTQAEAAKIAVQAYKQPYASSISKKNLPIQPKLVSPISKKKIYDTLLPHFTKAYVDTFIKENFTETENGLIKK